MARRRGQAALEFLSTYGFAFLLILVMIGALSYFGILSPQRFLPSRCLINSEFSCQDSIITLGPTPSFSVLLVNNLPTQITINGVGANSVYGNANGASCTVNSGALPQNVASGARFNINCSSMTTAGVSWPAVGEKVKLTYKFNYTQTGLTYQKSADGDVANTLQS